MHPIPEPKLTKNEGGKKGEGGTLGGTGLGSNHFTGFSGGKEKGRKESEVIIIDPSTLSSGGRKRGKILPRRAGRLEKRGELPPTLPICSRSREGRKKNQTASPSEGRGPPPILSQGPRRRGEGQSTSTRWSERGQGNQV